MIVTFRLAYVISRHLFTTASGVLRAPEQEVADEPFVEICVSEWHCTCFGSLVESLVHAKFLPSTALTKLKL